MKYLYQLILLLTMGCVITACVDDYTDANPEPPLDSPLAVLEMEADTLVGGETVEFAIRVVEAPGGIDSVGYITTDNKGTVTINEESLAAVRGANEGVITGTFTAPFDARGDFNLTLEVYDDQGEQQKKYTVGKDLYIVPFYEDASIEAVTADSETVNVGDSTTIYIDIVAPANIQNVRIFASSGEVELNQASLDAAIGSTSATVTATYTAPSAPTSDVGPVEFTIFVEDEIQGEEISDTFTPISVVYPFAEPQVSMDVDDQFFEGTSFEVSVEAPGTIDSVMVSVFRSGTEEEVGSVSYDASALEGATSGTFTVDFDAEGTIGYVDVVVTVMDAQGATGTAEETVLVEACLLNLAGNYATQTSGSSTDDCPVNNPLVAFPGSVSITQVEAGTFSIDDFFAGAYIEWYGTCYGYTFKTPANFVLSCRDNSISVPSFTDGFGADVSGSGTYNPATGVITITWENSFGDTATTVFTPQ